jgi:DNA-binding response OmpR family regulator
MNMREDQLDKSDDAAVIYLATLQQLAAQQRWPTNDDQTECSTSYRLALGQETIQLGIVEFRILLYLAGRPYHAFTRRSIADTVSSERDPVVEDTVDQHVASLLNQLGVFHDYVQSVPYIGYRFKA